MAYTADTNDTAFESTTLLARIGNVFAMIGQAAFVSRGMEARAEKLRELQMKTDEELAGMGLRRDELPAYVFRDLMFV